MAWLSALLLAGAAHAGADDGQSGSQPMDIEVEAPDAVRTLLRQHLDAPHWDLAEVLTDDARRAFVQARIERQARELLETEGYYTPHIDIALHALPPRLVLAVRPGARARVAAVELKVSGAVNDAHPERVATLHATWALPVGAPFRHADWEAAKRAALLPLLTGAYPAARIVASEARVEPSLARVTLHLAIDSGPAHRFGDLDIRGLQRYPRTLVERLSPITAGDWHAQDTLLEFQARLRDSPYFSSATVAADLDAGAPERTPVRVELQERQARRLAFGIGVSTDAGPRGRLEYGDLNLRGRALRLSTALVLDRKRQTLNAGVERPVDARGYRDGLVGRFERSDIAGQQTHLTGLGLQRARVQGRLERVLRLDLLDERQSVAGADGARNQTLYASHDWIRRDVDDPLAPTRGYLASLHLGAGLRLLASDQDFARTHARLAWFMPVGERGTLTARGELAALLADSRTGIPADLLFRAGGDQSVRGYAYQSLGVRQGDAVVGGRYLAVGSLEYVHWLRPQWGLGVFWDVGGAADRPGDLASHHGYGLGVRWRSPVGPLNLDLAQGRDGGGTRLHFNAGLAF
jgi:translocation and assembly module TamA